MAKSKDRRSEGLFSFNDIMNEAKSAFHISENNTDEAINRQIRRTVKEKYKTTMIDGTYYVDRHTLECVLLDLDSYFSGIVSETDKKKYAIGKSVEETIQDHVSEIKHEDEKLKSQLSEAGITKDDYMMLLSDEATLGEYVTLDELLYLGLKGIKSYYVKGSFYYLIHK